MRQHFEPSVHRSWTLLLFDGNRRVRDRYAQPRYGGLVKPSLPDVLCTECGLCCDGSLFSEVELRNSTEASALECAGLKVEDADEDEPALLLQPCGALKGTRCGIYRHRPQCCRTFECRLLQDVRRGYLSIMDAKLVVAETVQRINHLAGMIGSIDGTERLPLKERYFNALERSGHQPSSPGLKDKSGELKRAMMAVETIIAKSFLT